jgi:hypothetical protein
MNTQKTKHNEKIIKENNKSIDELFILSDLIG